jgi:hypothetical protein
LLKIAQRYESTPTKLDIDDDEKRLWNASMSSSSNAQEKHQSSFCGYETSNSKTFTVHTAKMMGINPKDGELISEARYLLADVEAELPL